MRRMKTTTRIALLLGALALCGPACTKPDPAVVHREAANEFLNKGEWAKAVAEFDQSLAIDPKQAEVWKRKGWAHMQADEIDKMEAALAKRAELLPEPDKKAEVYRDIANVYIGKRDGDKAEPWFTKALGVDPNDDQALQWLGELYSTRGGARDMKAAVVPEKLDKAIEYYDKLIKVKPDYNLGYINKRIAINRYRDWEKQQLKDDEQAVKDAGADKEKAAAAQEKVDKHKARIEEFNKQWDELAKKLTELAKTPAAAAPAASK
jgi:tetratricopeptide (TPR) repeat protein